MAGLTVLGRRVEALLLDLDGTLVDSEPVHREGFRRFFAARGWRADESVLRMFTGRRADDVFASAPGPWSGEDPHELFLQVVSHTAYDMAPDVVPGATALLDLADEHEVPYALVTSADLAWAERALDVVGGIGRFRQVVTRGDIPRGKPDPDGYLMAMEALALPPTAYLAAEDTPAGVRSACAAGAGFVVGVSTSFPATALQDAGADVVLPDLVALSGTWRPDQHT